jgi:hypothetical protein
MGLWDNFLNAWDGSSSDLQDMRSKLLSTYMSSIQLGNSKIVTDIIDWPANYANLGGLPPIIDEAKISAWSFGIKFLTVGNQDDINSLLLDMTTVELAALGILGGSVGNIALSVDVLNSQVAGLQASTSGVTAGWVEQLVEQAEQQATAQYNQAVSYVQQLYNQAVARADADQAAAEQQATAQYNQATSYSQQLYNQAISHADQDMAAAEQQATNQHNQAEQDAQNAANQAQSNAQGYTDGAVRGAEALAAASLALQVASDAAEFATLTAGVAAVADLAGDAIMANGLLQLLEAGAFFGFLALAIKEPVGTANVSVGVLDPLLDQAGALVDDVIGFLV